MLLAAEPTLPTVIAGDLNSTPTGLPRSETSDHGNAIDVIDASELFTRQPHNLPVEDSEMTFRSDRPINVIDWIIASNDLPFSDYRIVASELSDHRPVVADFVFGP